MTYSDEIKKIRTKSLLSQEAFAKALGLAFSTINRWERGRSKPNITSIKTIKKFCLENNIPYESIEEAWLDYKIEK